MNKRFLLVAALCAAMNLSAFAQENLALNKSVVVSTEAENDNKATKITDGILGTRWEVNANDAEKEAVDADNDYTVTKGHWFYIDLGEETEFNTLRISWDPAYAKKFEVYTATEMDNDTNEPKWENEAVLIKEETLTNFSKNYTYFLSKTAKARYVKLVAKKLGFAGNWFSVNEMGIYNVTEEQKKPTIGKMTASAEYVKPGDTFTISILDQWDNAMSDDITYACTNATQENDGSFKATTEGEVIVKATDKQNNEKEVKLTAYTPALTTVKVSPTIVVTNQETELKFTVKDQQGKDLTGYTTSVTDNKLTATTEGKQEITVKYGNKEEKLTIYAVSSISAKPTLGTEDVAVYVDSKEGLTFYNKEWEGGYDEYKELEINGQKALLATKVATFGMLNNTKETGFTTLNFDIYTSADVENPYINYEGSGLQDIHFDKIEAGKWQHVSLDVTDATNYGSYIKFKLGSEGATTNPDILVTNIYLSKQATTGIVVSPTANEKGIYTVKGTITADNVAELTEKDGTAFDLTKATIDENIKKIEFKNPNALVIVKTSSKNNTWTFDEVAEQLTETKNVITTDGTWFAAGKQLVFDDDYAIPTSIAVNTKEHGYKYTRRIKANAWVTTCLPYNVTEITSGIKAFGLDEESTGETVSFKEATVLDMHKPYLLHNSTNEDVVFETTTKGGDLDLTKSQIDNNLYVAATNVTFQGNYVPKNGTEAEYGLQNATVGDDNKLTFKKIGTGATIGTFRAYFTLNDNTADGVAFSIRFPGNGTTGIGNVNAVANAKIANGVYTLDGRKVSEDSSINNLPKGIYIVNGKKIVK